MKDASLSEARDKRGLVGESITNIILWIIFFILAATAVWFLVRSLTS